MSITNLPSEIFLAIIEQLYMPDIRELALCSRQMHNLCSERLEQQLDIAARFECVELGNFKKLPHYRFIPTCLLLMSDILEGRISPNYIFEVSFASRSLVEYTDMWLDHQTHTRFLSKDPDEYTKARDALFAKMRPLARAVVDKAFWIRDSAKDRYVADVCWGSVMGTLCVLLPMLPNLRALKVIGNGTDGELCGFFRRIARISAKKKNPVSMPLSKLLVVSCPWDSRSWHGKPLGQVMSYAALPSVRRVNIHRCQSSDFRGWYADLPLSRATEVYFTQSSIQESEVRAFMSGFQGPCVVRKQWPEEFIWRGRERHGPDWNLFEIDGDGKKSFMCDESENEFVSIEAGSRKETFSLIHAEGHKEFWYPGRKVVYFKDDVNAVLEDRLHNWREVLRKQQSSDLCSPG